MTTSGGKRAASWNCSTSSPQLRPLLAWQPTTRRNVCFLVPSAATWPALDLAGDPFRAPVVSLRLMAMPDQTVVLTNPTSGCLLYVDPPEGTLGRVTAGSATFESAERFTLVAAEAVAPELASVAARLEALLAATADAPAALAHLLVADPPTSRGWLPAVLRLLQPGELEWLAGQSGGACRQRCLRDDVRG